MYKFEEKPWKTSSPAVGHRSAHSTHSLPTSTVPNRNPNTHPYYPLKVRQQLGHLGLLVQPIHFISVHCWSQLPCIPHPFMHVIPTMPKLTFPYEQLQGFPLSLVAVLRIRTGRCMKKSPPRSKIRASKQVEGPSGQHAHSVQPTTTDVAKYNLSVSGTERGEGTIPLTSSRGY